MVVPVDPARPLNVVRPLATAASARRVPERPVTSEIVLSRDTATRQLVTLTGDDPPSEFRIFTAGKVETTKGTFIFDAAAAKSVMADYVAHGIDLMIDYDHASLGVGVDPALSGKAAGWFNIEVRNGELWAINVRWNEPAAEALRRKEWRFMSPAFALKDGRITSLVNVALTNIPATRQLEPLMAANVREIIMASESALSPKLVKSLLDAMGNKDPKAALALLPALLGELLGLQGDPDASTEDAPPPAGDGGADEATEPADAAKDPKMAAGRLAMALTGKKNAAEAMAELTRTYKLAAKFEERETVLAADRAKLDLEVRKENAIKLTKLGAETPHTTGLASGTLCKRLADEPLDEQNSRVAALLAAHGGKLPETPKPPPAGGTDPTGLTAVELAMCKQMNCDPATYLTLKAQRDGATTKAGV